MLSVIENLDPLQKLLLLLAAGIISLIYSSYRYINSSKQKSTEKVLQDSTTEKIVANVDVLLEPTPLMLSIEQLKTYDDRPWRPFRWPYHQTMSTFKLDINHWLDMDKYYLRYLNETQRVQSKYGKENFEWLPESYDACFELMEVVSNHLLKRFPLLFTKVGESVIKNEIKGDIIDMSLPLDDHPLEYVARLALEDFYIVMQRDDGLHYLVATAVTGPGGHFPVRWNIGKPLDTIHDGVPYYEESLKKSMEKWFNKFEASKPVERASWHMTWDHKLKVNDITRLHHDEKVPNDIPPSQFNVRIDRQALRRLPKTKAIIFSNHPIFYSIEEMKDEPMIPSILKKIIYEAPEKIIEYKHFESVRDHLSPYLDGLIERQIKLGLIRESDPVRTIPSYPFANFLSEKTAEEGWNNPYFKDSKGGDYTPYLKRETVQDDD